MQTRRSLIKKGLFGGAILAVGGAGFLASRGTRRVDLPPEGLLVLNADEYAVIHAIAGRLVPAKAGFPSVDEVRVAFNADRVLSRADAGAVKELRQLINLLENGLTNLLFGGRPRAFTQLSPEAQDQVLQEWQNSGLTIRRTGFQALRAITLASYYGSPMTWKAVGYPGPPEGFQDKTAPKWKGGGEARPPSNGLWQDEEANP
jgi:hypothetical protein